MLLSKFGLLDCLELEAHEHGERVFDREGDAVRLDGVPTNLGDLEFLGLLPKAVAAVAAEILASEHVAADTPQMQLTAR